MTQSNRPIAFFDYETTSADPATARIVQIALVITDRNFNVLHGPFQTLVNPEIPIDPRATEVHHITDDMVATAPTFATFAPQLFDWLDPCDWGFYNGIKFDAAITVEEFARVGIDINPYNRQLIDPCQVFFKKEPRDLTAALKFYTGETMEDAHEALADIMATVKVAKAQVERYEDINSVDDIYNIIEPEKMCDLGGKFVLKDGEPAFAFGPHIGKLIKEEKSFLTWMMGKDFAKTTKDYITKFLEQDGTNQ